MRRLFPPIRPRLAVKSQSAPDVEWIVGHPLRVSWGPRGRNQADHARVPRLGPVMSPVGPIIAAASTGWKTRTAVVAWKLKGTPTPIPYWWVPSQKDFFSFPPVVRSAIKDGLKAFQHIPLEASLCCSGDRLAPTRIPAPRCWCRFLLSHAQTHSLCLLLHLLHRARFKRCQISRSSVHWRSCRLPRNEKTNPGETERPV